MQYIFCASYLSIIPALRIINDGPKKKSKIVTSVPEIKNFISEFLGPSYLFPLDQVDTNIRTRPLRSIASILKFILTRKKVLKEFDSRRPIKLYFFFIAENIFESWLINSSLKKKNTLAYYLPSVSGYRPVRSNIKDRVKCAILTAITSTPHEVKKCGSTRLIGPKATHWSTFKNFRTMNENALPALDERKVHLLLENYLNKSKIDVLILPSKVDSTEESNYALNLQKIIDYSSSIKITTAVKQHPQFPLKKYREFSGAINLPKYIPGSILMSWPKIVIGYCTAGLIEAALMGKTAISLLNIIESADQKYVKTMKDYLKENSSNKVLFPTSLADVQKLITKSFKENSKT